MCLLIHYVLVNYFAIALYAFNVDLRTRIIHRGERRSMFGYDVDMFKHYRTGQVGLLVGAPRAQTGQPGVRNGGAVYRCEPEDQRCTKIFFDTAGHGRALNGSVLLQIDSKSDQWFGATVVSSKNGDSVLACAPRYTYFYSTFERKEPVGTCYLAQNSFNSFREFSPCRMETRWGYHRLGFCMAGFSAAISDENDKLFIGAPGAWYWQGALIVQGTDREDNVQRTSEGPARLDDIYLGYSIAAGNFRGGSGNDVAIGAPKGGDLSGMVALFDDHANVLVNITGQQVGSYFGAALAVDDLNNDGLDDLIIGAPLYSLRKNEESEENSVQSEYEVGAVYVYFQNMQHKFPRHTKIVGHKEWSRFGHDVATTGDLNGDGYNDFIVGAPFDGPSKKGAVYIYHGSKKGVNEEFSQVIHAREVDPTLTTFGWSISGGIDVDGNEYPDIFVGAYKSDRAVLFKSRPVVSVSGFVKANPDVINLENKFCRLMKSENVPCAQLRLCLQYSGKGVPDELYFRLVINLDAKKGLSSRARFLESHSITQLTLDSVPIRKGERWCERRYIYVIDDIRDKLNPIVIQLNYSISDDALPYQQLRPVKDAYMPGVITGEVNIQKDCGRDNICIPDLQMTAQLNKEAILIGADDRFNVSVTIHNGLEDAFEAQFFVIAPIGLDYEGFTRQLPIRTITCSQPKEFNEKSYVISCDIGNPLPRATTVRFNLQFSTENVDNIIGGISLHLITNSTNNESASTLSDNEVTIDIPMEVKADFIVTGVSRNETYDYEFSEYRKDIVFDSDAGPLVSHVYEIRNLGPTMLSEVSVDIYWPSFFRDNFKPLLYLTDDIQSEGKVTCELLQKGHLNPEGLTIMPSTEEQDGVAHRFKRNTLSANMHRYEEKSFLMKALRDAVAMMKDAANDFRNTIGQMRIALQRIKVDCTEMACTQWRCKINDFKRDERVLLKIDARLWINTLIEEVFYDAMISSVAIAEVTKLPYKHPDITLPLRYAVVSTIVNPNDPTRVGRGVPGWLIFVAVLAGLACLILLIMLLWRFGFFKRKRPPRGQALLSKPPEAEYYGYSTYSSTQPGGFVTYGNPQYRRNT
ncbi:hypothetical protein M514_03640 [Trichuris suis]|uniref:Uncharacterized protein n=1 Tax=Trichuris suis TaxID=68888 RepID=A0A085N053_9BILA|nr:hypothetical protein M513_03640 [Trichuris suis]KFD62849.1 hypothetical protein M514_03640 [Trichuris suis]